MRSFMLIGVLALVVGVIFLRGYLPSEAGASSIKPKLADEIELEYSDYETEAPLIITRRQTHDEPSIETTPARISLVTQNDDTFAPVSTDRRPAEIEPTQPPPTEDPDPAPAMPGPIADAGTGRTVWLGADELPLDAGGSAGDGLLYSWRQLAGPSDLNIKDASTAKTIASGFPLDEKTPRRLVYEFQVTVRDVHGHSSTDTVRHVVLAGPSLSISPRPRRWLAYRDGYLLTHYQVSRTNSSEFTESFEVRSAAELSFNQLSGEGEFEIVTNETHDGYVYLITVYYQDGEPATWLEFFADTPERIPAILQFSIDWE